jgi:NDP-sugar pyrophosphorylase family protein
MNALAVTESLPSLALLAGGLATRLLPLTETIPKSMILVAGEPFIAHQLRLLAREGVTDVVICSGYLGEQIEAFVSDGGKFGCRVRFSPDGDKPLGTGGALRRALPMLGECFMVMYGDSYLDTRFRLAYKAFRRSALPALMTVFRNEHRWDTSNVEFVDGRILRYDKLCQSPAMLHIDYGLGILSADVVRARPLETAFDLADLYHELVKRRLLAGYEVRERFYEIGSRAGLAETELMLRRVSAVTSRT